MCKKVGKIIHLSYKNETNKKKAGKKHNNVGDIYLCSSSSCSQTYFYDGFHSWDFDKCVNKKKLLKYGKC